MNKFAIILFLILSILIVNCNAQDDTLPPWQLAKSKIIEYLKEEKRTLVDIEQPEWYANYYSTVGRMPIVDYALENPLNLPDVANHFDNLAHKHADSMHSLFTISEEMCDFYKKELPGYEYEKVIGQYINKKINNKEISTLINKIKGRNDLNENLKTSLIVLVVATSEASILRDDAFSTLTQEEKTKIAELLPGYFLPKKNGVTSFRGYTGIIDDCDELIFIINKIKWDKFLESARIMAQASDIAKYLLKKENALEVKSNKDVVFIEKSPFGKIIIGNKNDSIYTNDYAILIELGGNDLYKNNSGSTNPNGLGISVLIDCDGDDVYKGQDFTQGCAFAGVSVFMDFNGNDSYSSRHYSQGAALAGFSMFYEGGGDDTYSADLGAQSFAIFGYSVFTELGGNDSYRCQTMGQGFASTLGVSLLVEKDGNDVYVSGGKYGFYGNIDSSAAQGAASGMRPWPVGDNLTVYGGVALLTDGKGDDRYSAYAFAQGGSYILALGMFVDSEGNDQYHGTDYVQGSGCHLGAAVCIDKKGNDIYRATDHSTGGSLDRSSAVFCDYEGDDVYVSKAGIGYAGKPNGIGVFFDAFGNDTYCKGVYGLARPTYSESTHSTTYFLDFQGEDIYDADNATNNNVLRKTDFSVFSDFEKTPEDLKIVEKWTMPIKPDIKIYEDEVLNTLNSENTLTRFGAYGSIFTKENPEKFMADIALNGHQFARKSLIDNFEILRVKKKINLDDNEVLLSMLDADDFNVRLIPIMLFHRVQKVSANCVEKIVDIACNDKDFRVRGLAVIVVGLIKDKKYGDNLIKIITDDDSWQVRRRAAIAIRILGVDENIFEGLKKCYENDKDYRSRTKIAGSIGSFQNEKAEAFILSFMDKDKNNFVKYESALKLVMTYNNKKGIEQLIELLDWDNWVVKSDIKRFLVSITGENFTANEEWQKWWDARKVNFDTSKYITVFNKIQEAQNLVRTKNINGAITIYKQCLEIIPSHSGVKRNYAMAINTKAWDVAYITHNAKLTEKEKNDVQTAIKLCQEAVKISRSNQYLDTLAVLHFINGEKDIAVKLIKEAIEITTESKKGLYRERLKQFNNGKLQLD